jgi:hypothetical protein
MSRQDSEQQISNNQLLAAKLKSASTLVDRLACPRALQKDEHATQTTEDEAAALSAALKFLTQHLSTK